MLSTGILQCFELWLYAVVKGLAATAIYANTYQHDCFMEPAYIEFSLISEVYSVLHTAGWHICMYISCQSAS